MYQIQQLFPCIQVHSFNFLLKKTTEIENRCFSGLLRGRVQERCEKSFRFRPQKHTKHGYVDYKLHRELFVIFCVCVYMCVCVCVFMCNRCIHCEGLRTILGVFLRYYPSFLIFFIIYHFYLCYISTTVSSPFLSFSPSTSFVPLLHPLILCLHSNGISLP